MRKETDLRQVKATARALLMLDIGKTEYSPMIVKYLMDITEVQDIASDFTMTM